MTCVYLLALAWNAQQSAYVVPLSGVYLLSFFVTIIRLPLSAWGQPYAFRLQMAINGQGSVCSAVGGYSTLVGKVVTSGQSAEEDSLTNQCLLPLDAGDHVTLVATYGAGNILGAVNMQGILYNPANGPLVRSVCDVLTQLLVLLREINNYHLLQDNGLQHTIMYM